MTKESRQRKQACRRAGRIAIELSLLGLSDALMVLMPMLMLIMVLTLAVCLIPMGLPTPSVGPQIAECQRILEKSGLEYKVSIRAVARSINQSEAIDVSLARLILRY